MREFLRNFKAEAIILFLALVTCILISASFWNMISIWYLIIPLLILGSIGVMSYNLKNRFRRTFGLPGFLTIVFLVLTATYFFQKYFPVTNDTLVSQRKKVDLDQFDNFEPGMDAKKKIQKLQKENDSLTNLITDYIMQERDTIETNELRGKVAKNLQKLGDISNAIKVNDNHYFQSKKYLFEGSEDKNNNGVSSFSLDSYNGKVEHRGPNEVFVKFNGNDTVYTDLIIHPGDTYSFINPTAPFRVDGYQNPSYVIKQSIDFEAKRKNMIKIYGCGFKGTVTIKLYPAQQYSVNN